MHPKNFILYGCLPFIELAHESMIELGPVCFWAASKSKDFLSADENASFQAYLQTVGQTKAKNIDNHNQSIHTKIFDAKRVTCISINEKVPNELRQHLLIDSLYLLYFACTFRNLYYGHEIPSFNVFRKLIPGSLTFIQEKSNWENLYIHETDREETLCLHLIDLDIRVALGKILDSIYVESHIAEQMQLRDHKRLVRAIRYLVDRFFQRFINLFEKDLIFSNEMFEPEDIIFLSTSFETLFDIDQKDPAADFKHKLRSLLHLKYSQPIEIFWKWVNDFYAVKKRMVYGEPFRDPLFRLNPNFEISHIFLGIKLFVYSVYYKLYKFNLLSSLSYENHHTIPDFKWIHPEETLLFFWTESSLLKKLAKFIKSVSNSAVKNELLADIHLLTHLFVAMNEHYYLEGQKGQENIVHFIATPKDELKKSGEEILELLKLHKSCNEEILQVIHPKFIKILASRLE